MNTSTYFYNIGTLGLFVAAKHLRFCVNVQTAVQLISYGLYDCHAMSHDERCINETNLIIFKYWQYRCTTIPLHVRLPFLQEVQFPPENRVGSA
jgi:hypothetical protein